MKIILAILKILCIVYIFALSIYLLTDLDNIYQSVFHGIRKGNILGHIFPKNWSSIWYWIFQVLSIAFKIFAIYLIFLFKDTIKAFSKRSFFTKENGENLIFIGWGIIILAVLLGLSELPFNIHESFQSSSLKNTIPYKSGYAFGATLKNTIPKLIFSLFFILLGSIIKEGEGIKEENDLTI